MGIVAIFAGFALVCLHFGYRAPADKVQEVGKLIHGLIGVGALMQVIRRFFSGFSS